MKIYSVAKVVIETEVPEDDWSKIDFTEADKIAHENLRWMCEHNDWLPMIHFKNEEDAQDYIGE